MDMRKNSGSSNGQVLNKASSLPRGDTFPTEGPKNWLDRLIGDANSQEQQVHSQLSASASFGVPERQKHESKKNRATSGKARLRTLERAEEKETLSAQNDAALSALILHQDAIVDEPSSPRFGMNEGNWDLEHYGTHQEYGISSVSSVGIESRPTSALSYGTSASLGTYYMPKNGSTGSRLQGRRPRSVSIAKSVLQPADPRSNAHVLPGSRQRPHWERMKFQTYSEMPQVVVSELNDSDLRGKGNVGPNRNHVVSKVPRAKSAHKQRFKSHAVARAVSATEGRFKADRKSEVGRSHYPKGAPTREHTRAAFQLLYTLLEDPSMAALHLSLHKACDALWRAVYCDNDWISIGFDFAKHQQIRRKKVQENRSDADNESESSAGEAEGWYDLSFDTYFDILKSVKSEIDSLRAENKVLNKELSDRKALKAEMKDLKILTSDLRHQLESQRTKLKDTKAWARRIKRIHRSTRRQFEQLQADYTSLQLHFEQHPHLPWEAEKFDKSRPGSAASSSVAGISVAGSVKMQMEVQPLSSSPPSKQELSDPESEPDISELSDAEQANRRRQNMMLMKSSKDRKRLGSNVNNFVTKKDMVHANVQKVLPSAAARTQQALREEQKEISYANIMDALRDSTPSELADKAKAAGIIQAAEVQKQSEDAKTTFVTKKPSVFNQRMSKQKCTGLSPVVERASSLFDLSDEIVVPSHVANSSSEKVTDTCDIQEGEHASPKHTLLHSLQQVSQTHVNSAIQASQSEWEKFIEQTEIVNRLVPKKGHLHCATQTDEVVVRNMDSDEDDQREESSSQGTRPTTATSRPTRPSTANTHVRQGVKGLLENKGRISLKAAAKVALMAANAGIVDKLENPTQVNSSVLIDDIEDDISSGSEDEDWLDIGVSAREKILIEEIDSLKGNIAELQQDIMRREENGKELKRQLQVFKEEAAKDGQRMDQMQKTLQSFSQQASDAIEEAKSLKADAEKWRASQKTGNSTWSSFVNLKKVRALGKKAVGVQTQNPDGSFIYAPETTIAQIREFVSNVCEGRSDSLILSAMSRIPISAKCGSLVAEVCNANKRTELLERQHWRPDLRDVIRVHRAACEQVNSDVQRQLEFITKQIHSGGLFETMAIPEPPPPPVGMDSKHSLSPMLWRDLAVVLASVASVLEMQLNSLQKVQQRATSTTSKRKSKQSRKGSLPLGDVINKAELAKQICNLYPDREDLVTFEDNDPGITKPTGKFEKAGKSSLKIDVGDAMTNEMALAGSQTNGSNRQSSMQQISPWMPAVAQLFTPVQPKTSAFQPEKEGNVGSEMDSRPASRSSNTSSGSPKHATPSTSPDARGNRSKSPLSILPNEMPQSLTTDESGPKAARLLALDGLRRLCDEVVATDIWYGIGREILQA